MKLVILILVAKVKGAGSAVGKVDLAPNLLYIYNPS